MHKEGAVVCPLAGKNFDESILPTVDDFPHRAEYPVMAWHAGTPIICSGFNHDLGDESKLCFRLDWVSLEANAITIKKVLMYSYI